jgi:hypothetical protein
VHYVKESDGRLKDDGYGWTEVDDKIAWQKVRLASKPNKAVQASLTSEYVILLRQFEAISSEESN